MTERRSAEQSSGRFWGRRRVVNALGIVKKCAKDRHLNTLLPSPRCLSFPLLAYF